MDFGRYTIPGFWSFEDVIAPAQALPVNINFPDRTFVHDINDDGYNPATDTLISAELILSVRDDVLNELPLPLDPQDDPMRVLLDGVFNNIPYEVNLQDIVVAVDVGTLEPDGRLQVTVGLPLNPVEEWAWVIQGSTLRVVGERDIGSVPVPGTTVLLMAGLLLLRRQLKSTVA